MAAVGFTPDDVQKVERLAAGVAIGARREFGENILREHTEQLRSMAERLRAEFISCSPSTFTSGEIDVLKRAAKNLEGTSAGLAEDPKITPEAKHDARLRLEIAGALRRITETLESRGP